MGDSLENIRHEKFTYVLIPAAIEDPVKVLEFEGLEKKFRVVLKSHFSTEKFLVKEKEKFSKDLQETTKNALGDDHLARAVELSETYQIISLTVPTPKNNYEAINAYIDNVGRVKNSPKNARASRVTDDDIRGDCFLSRTFDDENIFKRISFTMADYEAFLKQPPSSSANRWSQTAALQNLQKQIMAQQNPALGSSNANSCQDNLVNNKIQFDEKMLTNSADTSPVPHCTNCGKKEIIEGTKLLKCGRCAKVYYCSKECQAGDWKFHKRICKAK